MTGFPGRRPCRLLAFSVLVFGLLAWGAAEGEGLSRPTPLPPVEVTAYRIPVLLEHLSYSVALIPRDDFMHMQPLTVADVLRAVPGVHLDRLGGPGGTSNVYLRGADPNHTLVMIDGIPINDPNDVRGGSVDLTSVALHDVERIEVLRGAHSAVFGADAMGGAINIVTARGDGPPRASARLGAGGQSLREASASAAAAGLTLGGSALRDGERGDGSRLRLHSASGSLALEPAPGWSVRASARATERRSEAYPESSGGVRFAAIRELERRHVEQNLITADTDFKPAAGPHWNLKLSRLERTERVSSPGVARGVGGVLPPFESDSRLTRELAALTAVFQDLPLDAAVTVGAQLMRERGRADTLIPVLGPGPSGYALSRHTRSLLAELRFVPMERLLVIASARRDDVSSLRPVVSRSVGTRWSSADGVTTLRANWSEGFKPPSFFALGSPLVGNPDLRPERSRTIEAGIDRRLGSEALVRATAFRNRYAELIDFDAATFRLVNRSRVANQGVELGLHWAVRPGVTLEAGYTRIAYRTEGDAPLRNRPRQRGSLGATAEVSEAMTLQATMTYVGRTRDFSVPFGETKVRDQQRLDLALRYRGSPHVELEAALDDVLDSRQESLVGFREPGRRFRLALSVAI